MLSGSHEGANQCALDLGALFLLHRIANCGKSRRVSDLTERPRGFEARVFILIFQRPEQSRWRLAVSAQLTDRPRRGAANVGAPVILGDLAENVDC
jgi:hypothetical protein